MVKIIRRKKFLLLQAIIVFLMILSAINLVFAEGADGPPHQYGPGDEQKVSFTGQNQKILVIYVQAKDYPILAKDLATANGDEDQKVTDFKKWYDETSWGQLTFDVARQRDTGGNWYVLPKGILDYCEASSLKAMEYRDSAQATSANPAPPTTVKANAAPPNPGDPDSKFDSGNAGKYFYAVSSIKNGTESKLTKITSAATVNAGDIVTLTIDKASGNSVDYYIIYRTGRNNADSLVNYSRIAYLDAPADNATFIDYGIFLADVAGDKFEPVLQAAMDAASKDIADFSVYKGIITVIYSSFLRGESQSYPLSFTVNGKTIKVQTIVMSSVTEFGRFSHEIGHWLELPDEYGVMPFTFWTTMDSCLDEQLAAWEKEYKLSWVDAATNIRSLERPAMGSPDLVETIKLYPTDKKDTFGDAYTAIKIKSSDTVHYYIEGRNHFAGYVSDASANKQVVVIEAVDAWPMDVYPKVNFNTQQVLKAGDPVYNPDPTVEITFLSTNPGTDETYNVRVKIKAQQRPDPSITPWGAPPWETPDIWVDSQREGGGFDAANAVTPKADNGESAWVDHVNRIYAKITNKGGGDAKGVKVHFKINTPGGVGDAGNFVDLPTVVPATVDIPAGESRYVYAEWKPTVNSHTCVKVEIEHVVGEEDIFNNGTQENITHFYTGASSPWHTVTFPVKIANPFETQKQIFLQVSGLATGWTATASNYWVWVDPGSYKLVDVSITPPADANPCDKLNLNIQAITEIKDFFQPYGGLNAIIHLANPIQFPELKVVPYYVIPTVKTVDGELVNDQPGGDVQPLNIGDLFMVTGKTDPPVANKEISLVITDPDGVEDVVFSKTNASGEFSYAYIYIDKLGEWKVNAYFAGDDCHAPTESGPITFGDTTKADLFVKLTGPAVVQPGVNAEYIVTYGNLGPDRSTAVLLKIQIPSGMQYVEDTLGLTELSPGVRGRYLGPVDAGTINSFRLTLQPMQSVTPNTELTITANIISGKTPSGPGVVTPDPDMSNNTATISSRLLAGLHAISSLILADRTKVTAAYIYGGLQCETGADSILTTSTLSANSDLFMRSRARVNGNVRIAGHVNRQDGVVITGTVTENASVTMPAVAGKTISYGSADLTINNDQQGSWTPGNYRDCMVRARGKLTLTTGVYNFHSVCIEPDASLILNTTAGAIVINVEDNLSFGDRAQISANEPQKVSYYTNCPNTVRIGTDIKLLAGSIIAPYGCLQINSRTTINGPILAKQIRTEPDTILNCNF